MLLVRIDELDIQKAIDDVKFYIKNPEELKIWNKDYFKFLVSNISYQQNEVMVEENLDEAITDSFGFRGDDSSALDSIKAEELDKNAQKTEEIKTIKPRTRKL